MKEIVLILLAALFTATADAQPVNKYSVIEQNQDQLNLELVKSLKKIKTGQILTGTGVAAGIIGGIFIGIGITESNNSTEILGGLPRPITGVGALILVGGVTSTGVGIINWAIGQNRKTAIEMELVKFQHSGSATVGGIGLRVIF